MTVFDENKTGKTGNTMQDYSRLLDMKFAETMIVNGKRTILDIVTYEYFKVTL
jgi:hypothetical protein